MRSSKILVALAAALVAFSLSACSQQTPSTPVSSSAPMVIAPIVMNVEDLQGSTIELVVGQALDINTGDLAVDSYSGEVEDPSVAEFIEGRDDGSATFNPGVEALAIGSTGVTLANDDGGIEDVIFTVTVTEPGQGGS